MKVSEIRGKDSRELRLDMQILLKELFGLRFRAASEEIGKTSRFQEIRRTVARIKTILREREIAAKVSAEPGAAAASSAVASGERGSR